MTTRRDFLAAASVGAATVLGGCSIPGLSDPTASGSARLTARPGTPTQPAPTGLRALGLGDALADGVIYVPASYNPGVPAPMMLLLHGAGGTGAEFIPRRIPEADLTGQIVLAPDSRKVRWDGIAGAFGPDIAFLDAALRDTFARYRVDASRLSVAGFSDGATMSLALGLANGDLFSRAVVWSPGYLIDTRRNGKASFFFSHGTADPVLNIDTGSRSIVPKLRHDGYAVEYREFLGVHEVPDPILHESMQWSAAP